MPEIIVSLLKHSLLIKSLASGNEQKDLNSPISKNNNFAEQKEYNHKQITLSRRDRKESPHTSDRQYYRKILGRTSSRTFSEVKKL